MKTCPVCDTDYPDQHTVCDTDGAVLIVSQELAPGSLVRGKYRIIRKIGQGGMGVVYLAEDTWLNVRVALKFLAGDLGKDPRFIKRFRTEARAAYQLRHPNIAEVVGLDQAEDGSLFIAMEYIEGPSLRAVLDQNPKGLAIPRALEIAKGIASGLATAHAQGTVHRDIKPENILLTRASDGTERVKILDFGIATVAETITKMTGREGLLLTDAYAAPEQWREMNPGEFDGRTDLYALGGVLYEMLTGTTPFHAHTTGGWMKQHCEESPKPPSTLRPELVEWANLDELLTLLLAKDRHRRPQDANAFLALLGAVRPHNGGNTRRPLIKVLSTQRETVTESPANNPTRLDELTSSQAAFTEPEAGKIKRRRWIWIILGVSATLGICMWRIFAPYSLLRRGDTFDQIRPQDAPVSAIQPSRDQAAQGQPVPISGRTPTAEASGASSPKASLLQKVVPPVPDPTKSEGERQALALLKSHSYAEAAPLLETACDSGSADACEKLGHMYFAGPYVSGEGASEDDARAFRLLTKACDGHNGEGCLDLSVLYERGEGGASKDVAQSAALLDKACRLGSPEGCYDLGQFYYFGDLGLDVNPAKAKQLFMETSIDTNSCRTDHETYRRDGLPLSRPAFKHFQNARFRPL